MSLYGRSISLLTGCIQFDTLGWDGSYFKIVPELQAEYEQGTKTVLQAPAYVWILSAT